MGGCGSRDPPAAAFRRALGLCFPPAFRIRFMAMCRDLAMFPGPFPLRRRIGSSWSTRSRSRRARAGGIEGGARRGRSGARWSSCRPVPPRLWRWPLGRGSAALRARGGHRKSKPCHGGPPSAFVTSFSLPCEGMPCAKGQRRRKAVRILSPPLAGFHKLHRPGQCRAQDQTHDLRQGIPPCPAGADHQGPKHGREAMGATCGTLHDRGLAWLTQRAQRDS